MKGTYAQPLRFSEVRGRPRTIVMILALLVATMVATPAAADHPDEPRGTPLVAPIEVPGNDACPYRINDPETGTYQFNVEGFLFVVDIVTDGTYFSFTSNAAVEQVVAKGGPNHNVYDYFGAGLFNVTHDSGLRSPDHPRPGRIPGLSHISFCFDDAPVPPQGEIAIEKTATGERERVHDWDITKTADITAVVLNPGESATVTWSIVVGYLGATDSNHKVTGVITVANVGALGANITSLTDLGENVTDCTLNGAPFAIPGTLAVGDEINCNYSVDVAATDDTNTATVAGTFTDGEAFSESTTESFTFGDPNPNLHETVNVSDLSDLLGAQTLGELNAPNGGTFTYQHTFSWDGDACGTATHPNTASVIGDGNTVIDSDDETVTVTIICPEFQGETVTGAGEEWPGSSNWFEFTPKDPTSDTHDLIQGRNKNVVGSVTITEVGDVATLCFSLTSPWELDPDKSGNVKIEPLDAEPTEYLPPGQYSFHFTRSGSSFCVDVDAGTFGYAIHLDAGFWVS